MSSAASVARDLVGLAVVTQAKVHASVVKHTALLEAAAKREASQPRTAVRPRGDEEEGPRALTGHFRRSINRRVTKTATGSMGEVGSSAPQARALELGNPARGAKSYPYLRPAHNLIAPLFAADMETIGVPKDGQ
jgi:hypothetical protein